MPPEQNSTNPSPAPTSMPVAPPPSATVQPFHSAGGPLPSDQPPTKRRGPMVLVIILVILAGLAAAAYFLLPQYLAKAPTATPTPTASSAPPDDMDTALQDADTSLNDLNTNLAGADTALTDKQGDLSE